MTCALSAEGQCHEQAVTARRFFAALPGLLGSAREKNEAPHENDEPTNERFFRDFRHPRGSWHRILAQKIVPSILGELSNDRPSTIQ